MPKLKPMPMNILKRLSLILVILFFSIGCDQITKIAAEHTLKGDAPIIMLYNTIRLQYTENSGGFLGLGSTLASGTRFWMLFVFPMAGIIGMIAFSLFAHIKPRELVMLSLIIGGGASNLINRLAQDGRVTDFLNIGIGSLRTGIFNVADVFIMVGAAGLILFILVNHNKPSVPPNEPS